MSGNSGSTSTTTQQAPAYQVPYQQYGLDQAYSNYQNGPQVAGFSDQQNQAINNVTGMVSSGTPVSNAANNYATGVLNNGPTQNPYLDSTFNQAALATQNQLGSEFGSAGRNVDASQGLRSQQLNNLATQIYGGAYNTGVQQQEQALSSAPGLDQQQYNDQSQLYGAGQQVQNLANTYIQAPQNFLNNYLSQVNGNLGVTQTQQIPYNSATNALGGAASGAQIGNSLNGNYGGAIGGLLGGLAGYFG